MSALADSDPKARLTVSVPRLLKRKLVKDIPSRQRPEFTVKALEAALVRKEVIRYMNSIKRAPTNGEKPLTVLRRFRRQFMKPRGKA